MFGFFRRKKTPESPPAHEPASQVASAHEVVTESVPESIATEPPSQPAETAQPTPPADRSGWFSRLKSGLNRTANSIGSAFSRVKIDEDLYEELETSLLTSDAGVEPTQFILEALREKVRRDRLTDTVQVKSALREILQDILKPLEAPIDIDRANPLVLMISGVNGAGKTTTIGKLTHHLQREGKSVLLAAGDTFRAAAREQLAAWGERNNVTVISQAGGDPAAVAFDSVTAAKARGIDVAIVDTAGRLPTQAHLMDELKKIHRVIGKAAEQAPHESLLILDGNTGQNMLAQVKAFDDAAQVTGLIITKLDGTAKGGAIIALARSRAQKPLPIYFIGVGESLDDLQPFSAEEFVRALV